MSRPRTGYKTADGARVPGTTTITGRFKDSGALMFWAFNQGKSGAESLYETTDKAKDAGTHAHDMVEAHIKKLPMPDPNGMAEDVLKAANNSFMAYRSWESQTSLEILDTEMPLVSERYRFGGTPDAVGLVNGALCLVDWKTSNGVYPEFLIQLAAYKALWEENNPDKPIVGGFHLCRFAKEHGDFAHHYYSDLFNAWRMFQLLREAYDIDKELKARTR